MPLSMWLKMSKAALELVAFDVVPPSLDFFFAKLLFLPGNRLKKAAFLL